MSQLIYELVQNNKFIDNINIYVCIYIYATVAAEAGKYRYISVQISRALTREM